MVSIRVHLRDLRLRIGWRFVPYDFAPGLRDRIVDEQSEVWQHINVFVGTECIRFTGGLSTQVPDGAELMIVPAVSRGL